MSGTAKAHNHPLQRTGEAMNWRDVRRQAYLQAVRRVLRILFNVLTVLSLVLAVSIGALWVRSEFRADALAWLGSPGFAVESADGRLRFWLCREFPVSLPAVWHAGSAALTYRREGPGYEWDGGSSSAARGWLVTWQAGVLRYRRPQTRGPVIAAARYVEMVMPHGLLIAAMLVMPAYALASTHASRRRAARLREKSCPSCGYDLRATPGRCPECGVLPSLGLSHDQPLQ
jgi:hypothetical protein